MKAHKEYFQLRQRGILFANILAPNGDAVEEDGGKLEIMQKIFDSHPDVFPFPKNEEKIKLIMSLNDDMMDNLTSQKILSAKIINWYLYARSEDFFSIDTRNYSTGALYCDEIRFDIELELDSNFNELSEEDQDEIESIFAFGGIDCDLTIDGYRFYRSDISEIETDHLEEEPKPMSNVLEYSTDLLKP